MQCPPHDKIRDGLDGKLPEPEIERLYEHLDDCSECGSFVARLEENVDDIVSALRVENVNVASEESYLRMVHEAEQLHSSEPDAASPPVEHSVPNRIRDYDLLEPIGEGGMGTLYRAVHNRLKRQVAVKMVAPRLVHNPAAVARFMKEMEAVGKLEHDNLVRAFDAGEQDGVHYLVMELVEGLDVRKIVKRTEKLSVSDACEITRQAAEGLYYAHRKGLVHRDVKPANLMITIDGVVKVLDMGLALLASDASELAKPYAAVGTADYISPEQITNSHAVNGQADVYSLGCTLFHLLAGMPPHGQHSNLTVLQRLQAHVDEDVDPVNVWRPDVPPAVAELVASMLAKSPTDRPRDASAVANALLPHSKGADLVQLVRRAQRGPAISDAAPATPDVSVESSGHLRAGDSSSSVALVNTERQRELLRDFAPLVNERSQTARDIQTRFTAHLSDLNDRISEECRTLTEQFEQQISQLKQTYRTQRDAVAAKYESESLKLLQEEQAIEDVNSRHALIMEDAKQEVESNKERLLDEYKMAVVVPKQELEQFADGPHAECIKQLEEFKKRTKSIMRRRGCRFEFEDAKSINPRGDVGKSSYLKQFAANLAAANERYHVLHSRRAARFLEEGWAWLLMILITVAAIVPSGMLLGWDNWLWVAVSVVLGGLTGWIVRQAARPIARRQTLAVFPPLATAIATAETTLNDAMTAATTEEKAKQAALSARRDQRMNEIDQKWDERRSALTTRHLQQTKGMQDEIDGKRKTLSDWHDSNIAELDQQYPPQIKKLEHDFKTQRNQQDESHERQRVEIHAQFDSERQQLVARWSEGVATLVAAVDEMNQACDECCPPWSSVDAEKLRSSISDRKAPPFLRFAQFDYRLTPMEDAANTVAFQQTRDQFSFPAVLTFPQRPSLLLEAEGDGRGVATATLQNVMLRLLTSFPPGKVLFTIIDPTALGQNFSMFMHLADFDDRLIGNRIWTETPHINRRLADLTEHMENVIQKYLRNEFASIQEYNEYAGEVAEPFQVLVVANFPANFTEESARRLVSIANSGARCGVYTLISTDMKMTMPRNFDLADLETNSATLIWRDGRFWWNETDLCDLPLQLETPPGDEQLTSIVRAIGQQAEDANRVEVPFDTVMPDAGQWWNGDSRAELEVPLGRAGATQLQFMRLGKGTSQHVLISGKTGSGKSTLLHALITNLAFHYAPSEVEFVLIDFKKGVEFKPYASYRLPHARVIAIESEREFGMSVLERLDQDMRERGDLFRQAGVQDIRGYRDANPDAHMPRLLLIIDEFQEFFVSDDKISADASLLLDRLVRQGRAFGIHVILGSQTLAGAYSLARSTLGQMAVRIALQCSENDAHLILSENNTAARLLSRPGEAIYNDANGLMEGNHPFQVVWLADDQREHLLQQLADYAVAAGTDIRPAIVFEGNVAADLGENAQLQAVLDSPQPEKRPVVSKAWLGAAVSIKEATAAEFHRHGGSNLLIVGQREESALGVLTACLMSLAAQQSTEDLRHPSFYILDGTRPDAPEAGFWKRFAEDLPIDIHVDLSRTASGTITDLAAEVDRRVAEGDESAPPKFVFIYNLARFRDFRKSDDFGFGSFDDDAPDAPKQLATILQEGPTVGVHCLIWCDTFNTVTRWLDRQSVQNLSQRVLFQMSPSDSSTLMDTPAASRLGVHRAYFYSEEQGTSEKFRPYGMPSDDWMARVRDRLSRA